MKWRHGGSGGGGGRSYRFFSDSFFVLFLPWENAEMYRCPETSEERRVQKNKTKIEIVLVVGNLTPPPSRLLYLFF